MCRIACLPPSLVARPAGSRAGWRTRSQRIADAVALGRDRDNEGVRVAAALIVGLITALPTAGCGRSDAPAPAASAPAAVAATPRHLVLVTVDTLRADRVGAYGYTPAATPTLDALATAGRRMTRAWATAPVTLTSHASILSGLFPPKHGARHNGVAMTPGVATLATTLKAAGFATGAFVAAFPLDRRFGLAEGFDVYGDRLPRGRNGRPADERPGAAVVDEALAWRRTTGAARTFLWVHLFEPHAPYGNPRAGRNAVERYDDEVAEADRQVGRLLAGLGADRAATLVVVTADHGEAFGEHGEIGHSLFLYDTTLRVPLVWQGPGVVSGVDDRDVSLVDLAPTALGLLGVAAPPTDGVRLGWEATAGPRALYAETYAPFEDFGWSPLRAVRSGGLKYIQAPSPELYDLAADADETANLVATRAADVARLRAQVTAMAPAPTPGAAISADARRRLQSLGYLGGSGPRGSGPLADPKDRRVLAARLAEVTSGELAGPDLEAALRAIVREDPANPQAHLRLGYVLFERGQCDDATPHFTSAIRAGMPTADAHLGLAACLTEAKKLREAVEVLRQGAEVEPGNPVVLANRGLVLVDLRQPSAGVPLLQQALAIDPDLHQARFGLALVFARQGRRTDAEREASTLLERLPPGAPQRPEVERLLQALR